MKIKNLLMLIIGCLICALSFNIFLSPYHIVSGGVSGIAVILKNLFDYEEAITVLILSIFLLGISLIFLGKKATVNSVIGSILFPIFIYLTKMLLQYFDLNIYNRLLASLIGGVTMGIGVGIVYKQGYTTGGTEIIAKMINKYFHVSLGISTFIIDGIVTFMGLIVFDFETVIYSLITIYLMSILIDKVMLGLFGNKSFYIITTHPEEIKKYINEELGHGATIIKGKGAFTNEEKYVILVVIPTNDYYKLKDGLKRIDDDAFFVVSNSYEVGGGK